MAFGVINFVASVLSGFFGIFVLVFFVFYVSAGMPALRRWMARRLRPEPAGAVPRRLGPHEDQGRAATSRPASCSPPSTRFLSGIVFALIGLPYWLPLALWTGIVAQFVPNVGTYISIALPMVVGLTSGDPILGVYVLIWGIAYQQVENLTFEPRISARAVDLHPAVSFGAALLGAQLFGLSGALLGVPVAATAMALLEIYKRRYELTAADRGPGGRAGGPQRRAGLGRQGRRRRPVRRAVGRVAPHGRRRRPDVRDPDAPDVPEASGAAADQDGQPPPDDPGDTDDREPA